MEVHLWHIDLDQEDLHPEDVASILSPAERHRSEGFRLPRLAQRFNATRLAMRRLLGHYLNLPAHALHFATTPYGKPYVQDVPDFRFNLSHSDRFAILAIGLGVPGIGVDIECIKPEFDRDVIADLNFSEAERTDLQTTPEDRQNIRFFEIWTRKEAYAKGRGLGFSLDFRSFCTVGNGSALPASVIVAPGTSDGDRWYLFEANPASGYAGVLACPSPVVAIRHFYYDHNPYSNWI